ncbi:hypothetical protein ACIQCF_28275 [Streptomyces sp. NPDC088353]|uniref:hypothetical protein n=1 Tax=Streptomyces sp. NPDC088353 TaxID=3365855 RepID=UPI003822A043
MTRDSSELHRKLTRNQLNMILDAVNGLTLDFQWITNAPQFIAQEVVGAYGDDGDGLDPARTALADTIAAGPRLRALAVVKPPSPPCAAAPAGAWCSRRTFRPDMARAGEPPSWFRPGRPTRRGMSFPDPSPGPTVPTVASTHWPASARKRRQPMKLATDQAR